MTLKLTHTLNDRLELSYNDAPLFTYVYISQEDPWESRKPYFHPLRTLAGDVLTNFRPNDHRWHHGLAMTCAYVSGQNFWGGNSFVAGQGYVPLDNIGQHEHIAWEHIACTPDRLDLTERIAWVTSDDQHWIDETRQITVSQIDPDQGYWMLDMGFQLQNVSGSPLDFGSPATQGRPDGVGYGGLFWRGARDLTHALVMVADGAETRTSDFDVMGHAGAWLAFTGTHDGVDRSSTLVFIDQPGNPRYPNRWFARTESAVGASFAFTYDSIYTLEKQARLNLNYRVVIANGTWTRQQIADFWSKMGEVYRGPGL